MPSEKTLACGSGALPGLKRKQLVQKLRVLHESLASMAQYTTCHLVGPGRVEVVHDTPTPLRFKGGGVAELGVAAPLAVAPC